MIFGFNTDVKHGDTIYHVQSEARESEKLLQTQVFMRGRCIGKKAIPYAGNVAPAQNSDVATDEQMGDTQQGEGQQGDAQKEQQLRDQHRAVLEAIKEGRLESVLDRAESESLTGIKQLDLHWENANSVLADRVLTLRLRVTEDGSPVPSARLTLRVTRPNTTPFFTQSASDAAGHAEILLEVDDSELPGSSIMVQATHEGRSVTRKFALHRAG